MLWARQTRSTRGFRNSYPAPESQLSVNLGKFHTYEWSRRGHHTSENLGSTIDATDKGSPAPGASNARTYDPFGAARNADMSTRPHGTMNLADTVHGFTKHDEANDVWLIQTGGRIYDQKAIVASRSIVNP